MVALIVHAGAWNIPDEEAEAHLAGCRRAAQCGWDVLRRGGTALDAVEESVTIMEDDSHLNAGRGAVLNANGVVQLDASLMEGRQLEAGSVASVQRIRNPIRLARCVLRSPHVLLMGQGAESFAQESGLALCDPAELIVEREMARWQSFYHGASDHPPVVYGRETVGAVALDQWGDIAAGTSTGGSPNKHPGRVGDSALIGCGTYADNRRGGVSATGWGEGIIRVTLARTTVELLDDCHGAAEAAQAAVAQLQARVGGLAGVIVVDAQGKIGYAFNTPRLARAYLSEGMSEPVVGIEP
jgi:beta-aspartyl-peptidase (threonine type)